MTNRHISRILRESGLLLQHDYDAESLRSILINNREYTIEDFKEFKSDLIETGSKIKLLFLEYHLLLSDFNEFIKTDDSHFLAFRRIKEDLIPIILHPSTTKNRVETWVNESDHIDKDFDEQNDNWLTNKNGEVVFFVITPYNSLVSDYEKTDESGKPLSPVTRLIRLLKTEKKDILYILFYSLIIGLISLVLPLGIQTTVELISGGVFFSSVYVLIAIVIVGVLIAGGLQVVQFSLVEHLQRKIFTKASFEFAFRIPRLKAESILGNYAPELVNRFFDVITIQKGLPKLLIDLASGIIQMFFGLLLLSLYHPFFVFFSIGLVLILFIIFYITGPKGLHSSIQESKYKYKVVHWLEELARSLNSFKLAGVSDLPIRKTDYNVNNYLKYRKSHFNVLISQFSFIILFKAVVTGGLLIVGTILVVDRQITLGQFVASEVIIILILNSVEKIIMYMDVVYDMLTAVDKVSHVTDLPLEKSGGIDFPKKYHQTGYAIQAKDLYYKYPAKPNPTLNGITFEVKPGEHVCISGPSNAGKTTLMNLISGIYEDFEGALTVNNYSIRDLDLVHLRDRIGKNISQEDIFDGTILENITVGKPEENIEDAIKALDMVGLLDLINALPEGLNTHMTSGGKNFSSTQIHQLILARCLAKNPELVILNDYFHGIKRTAKLDLIKCLVNKDNHWTLIAVSNDPLIMASCDKVIVLNEGKVESIGKFDELMKSGKIDNYLD